MRKLVRSAQVYFPWAVDLKFASQRCIRWLLQRPFEYDFRAIRHFPNDGALFIDVGAHRGQSVQAIRMMATHPRIVSFEPNPLLANRLGEVQPVALGDRAGMATLHVPVYRGFVLDGLASLHEVSTYLSPRTLYGFDPSRLAVRTFQVEVRTLDSFDLDPFFIKIDVEGNETAVLRGGEETLARSRPLLLLETPDDDAVALLAHLGYAAYTYADGHFVGGRNPRGNTYFLTPQHVGSLWGSEAYPRDRPPAGQVRSGDA